MTSRRRTRDRRLRSDPLRRGTCGHEGASDDVGILVTLRVKYPTGLTECGNAWTNPDSGHTKRFPIGNIVAWYTSKLILMFHMNDSLFPIRNNALTYLHR